MVLEIDKNTIVKISHFLPLFTIPIGAIFRTIKSILLKYSFFSLGNTTVVTLSHPINGSATRKSSCKLLMVVFPQKLLRGCLSRIRNWVTKSNSESASLNSRILLPNGTASWSSFPKTAMPSFKSFSQAKITIS